MTADQIALLRTILMAVSTLTIVVGWYMINKQNNQRETRKELRKLLDDISKDLEKLTEEAFLFHTSVYNHINAMKIQTRIKLSIDKITRAAESLDMAHDMLQPCIDLRRSITYENFDSTGHQIFNSDNEIIERINDQYPSIVFPLEESFHKKYTL